MAAYLKVSVVLQLITSCCSFLQVSRSRCSSLIGAEGIVLQETQNTIKLINKHNKLKSDHLSSYSCTPTVCRDHRKFTGIHFVMIVDIFLWVVGVHCIQKFP